MARLALNAGGSFSGTGGVESAGAAAGEGLVSAVFPGELWAQAIENRITMVISAALHTPSNRGSE